MLIINYRLVHATGIIYRFRCGRDGLASVLPVFGLFCIVEVSCLGVMITRNPCYIVFFLNFYYYRYFIISILLHPVFYYYPSNNIHTQLKD